MDRALTVIVVVAAVTGAAHCGSVDPSDALAMELDVTERATLPRAGASFGSSVASSATDGDGTRYVAGIFSGALRIGPTVLSSHGGDDVFLARIAPHGDVAWARGVGSKGRESGVKVTFEDGRVKLVAMTNGAVDCGRGPLQSWSSEAFFLCTFAPDGAPIDGASFPTGRP